MQGSSPVRVLDRTGVRAVDRVAIEEFGIPGIVLMENAARCLTRQVLNMLADSPGGSVLIACGSGNNGGDGYALARHLHNRGVPVLLCAIGEPAASSDAGINRLICERMGMRIMTPSDLSPSAFRSSTILVDAIFGTGLDRPIDPESESTKVIVMLNESRRPILAVDVPSGLDCDSGRPVAADGPCVRAACTASFVGWKKGFLNPDAKQWLGKVVVCDIGAPLELVERFSTVQHV